MRSLLTASPLALLLLGACAPARRPAQQASPPAAAVPAHPPAVAAARVSFESQIRPILEARCQPCHFAGGKMYERLPFDRSQTVRELGEKLFTRIKDEREQALVRSFLAQEP